MNAKLVPTGRKREGIRLMVQTRMDLLGMSQAELAEKSGVAPPRICEFMTDSKNTGIRTVERLLKALGGRFVEGNDFVEWD